MKDRRYSIAREYCGHPKPRWVVRFCDLWIDHAGTRRAALIIAQDHQRRRLAAISASHY
jgi:hypothetical protein